MSRPNYKEIIEQNLENVEKWAAEGLSVKQIAGKLGMSVSTFHKYKAQSSDIADTVKKGRKDAIVVLENSLFQSATGYTRTVKKYAKVKRCTYLDGKKLEEWEEMQEYEEEEYIKPDTGAGIFLLKNWGKYMNEPKLMELRQQEIELKERQIENNTWGV